MDESENMYFKYEYENECGVNEYYVYEFIPSGTPGSVCVNAPKGAPAEPVESLWCGCCRPASAAVASVAAISRLAGATPTPAALEVLMPRTSRGDDSNLQRVRIRTSHSGARGTHIH